MSKSKFFVFMTVLVGAILVLAACGGGSGGSGGNAKIAIGPPASATNTVSKVILEAYGIDEDGYEEFQEGFGDAADLVQDGNIDISVGVLGLPAGSIESLQRSEEHTSELQSRGHLVCRLLLAKKKGRSEEHTSD